MSLVWEVTVWGRLFWQRGWDGFSISECKHPEKQNPGLHDLLGLANWADYQLMLLTVDLKLHMQSWGKVKKKRIWLSQTTRLMRDYGIKFRFRWARTMKILHNNTNIRFKRSHLCTIQVRTNWLMERKVQPELNVFLDTGDSKRQDSRTLLLSVDQLWIFMLFPDVYF